MTPAQLRTELLASLPADPKWTAWVDGVVERVGTIEDPRIARIAALCDTDGADVEGGDGFLMTSHVRAVLDAPSVSAARADGIDREAALEALKGWMPPAMWPFREPMLDAILALVQPAPPALDLAAVRRILTAALPADPKWVEWVEGRIEEIAKAAS